MNREIFLKKISDNLAILSTQVSLRNTINLYDINIISEDFYSGLLNIIYGYNLINVNTIDKNADAIDLIDKNMRVSIQVTSNNSSTKIKHTITEFIKGKKYNEFDHLYILILTRKKRYTTVFDTEEKFSFDKNSDILDINDLVMKIRTMDTTKLKIIDEYLQIELNDKYTESTIKKSIANEIETIIDLIEYISNHKRVKKQIDVEIDPQYKIYQRFKEFSENLIYEYTSLLVIYGSALENVYATLGIDEAQDLVTMYYLQDISIKFLEENNSNPVKALNGLVDYFEDKLSVNAKKYDKMAIKFYLISEMIKCSVFPNERGEYNDCKF